MTSLLTTYGPGDGPQEGRRVMQVLVTIDGRDYVLDNAQNKSVWDLAEEYRRYMRANGADSPVRLDLRGDGRLYVNFHNVATVEVQEFTPPKGGRITHAGRA